MFLQSFCPKNLKLLKIFLNHIIIMIRGAPEPVLMKVACHSEIRRINISTLILDSI